MSEQKIRLEELRSWRLLKQAAHIIRITLITCFIGILLLGVGILYLQSKPLPPPDLHATTQLYDQQGQRIDKLTGGSRRTPISIQQVPQHLIQATLAAEDHTFYQHMGFSIRGILRAAWVNLKKGAIHQGASTITQQLARNLYLTHDRTWSRKIKEALLTVQLELHYTKSEILEMYLNEVYYGNGAYGVGQAAQKYLHKEVQNLNVAESALLAGLPRGPGYYSPYTHLQRAQQRKQNILRLMAQHQYLTQEQAQQAMSLPLAIKETQEQSATYANYFRDYVVQVAIQQYGLDESLVKHGGLRIYTTLDPTLQKQAEQAVQQRLTSQDELQGSLLSVDPKTGHIKAMVGGKNYRQSQFNRVFAKRQPGSSFKPILYLSALQNGFTPLTQIISRPTAFWYDQQVYRPTNFRNQYPNRPITLREAIARSDNIYAVSALLQIGMDKEVEMARKLGIHSRLAQTPSLALGSYAVTPYEMTEAYTTIAANGIHRPLQAITKIVDRDGTVLVDNQPQGKQVIDPAYSFVLSDLLTSVFANGGTGHRIQQMLKQPIAGKTGTTDWDGWLIGYHPNLVTTVWVGFDQNQPLSHDRARLSQYIWGDFMRQAASRYPMEPYKIPPGVKSVRIDEESGLLATSDCQQARQEYFIKGTEPTQFCPLHQTDPTEQKGESILDKLIHWWKKEDSS